MEQLDKDAVRKMKVGELKDELKKRGFKCDGKKNDLVERLMAVILVENSRSNPDDVEEGGDASDDEDSSSDEKTDDKSDSDNSLHSTCKSKPTPKPRVASQVISFKDIEESIPTFSGDDKTKTITSWLRQFEELSELCQLSELQMILYCRRLLRGSAALFIKHEKTHKTWSKMSRALTKEFVNNVSSKLVHKELTSRKKLRSETLKEYFYKMMDIAAQCPSVEVESVIQYVIDGIDDDIGSKAILYGATTFKEFRKKLDTYETMKKRDSDHMKNADSSRGKRMDVSKSVTPDKNRRSVVRSEILGKRCFSCGSDSHVVDNCPDKSKGPKCFKCNSFGHIASKCPTSNCISLEQAETKPTVEVRVRGVCMRALLDSGSDLTLMTEPHYRKLNVKLHGLPVKYRGVGSAQLSTLGSFCDDFVIDGSSYRLEIHVIPDGLSRYPLILGDGFFKQTAISLQEGKVVTVKKMEMHLPEIYGIEVECLHEKVTTKDPDIMHLIESYKPEIVVKLEKGEGTLKIEKVGMKLEPEAAEKEAPVVEDVKEPASKGPELMDVDKLEPVATVEPKEKAENQEENVPKEAENSEPVVEELSKSEEPEVKANKVKETEEVPEKENEPEAKMEVDEEPVKEADDKEDKKEEPSEDVVISEPVAEEKEAVEEEKMETSEIVEEKSEKNDESTEKETVFVPEDDENKNKVEVKKPIDEAVAKDTEPVLKTEPAENSEETKPKESVTNDKFPTVVPAEETKLVKCKNETVGKVEDTAERKDKEIEGIERFKAMFPKLEMLAMFNEELEETRTKAKENIEKMQMENRRTFNKRRKKPRLYNVGDLVAIRRTQPGSKLHTKYLGWIRRRRRWSHLLEDEEPSGWASVGSAGRIASWKIRVVRHCTARECRQHAVFFTWRIVIGGRKK